MEPNCQHCGADLTDEWIDYKMDWSRDGVITEQMPCPVCGWDLLNDTTPAEVAEFIDVDGSSGS